MINLPRHGGKEERIRRGGGHKVRRDARWHFGQLSNFSFMVPIETPIHKYF